METADGYTIAHREELERAGNWALVRRSLDCQAFGVNLVEIAQGESIPEHDETSRDQEELFYVISGSPTLVIDGEDHAAPAGTFARLRPSLRRTVRNEHPDPAAVLIMSAPTTSGYRPMEWA
jgi:quercetin dioxygenase-like cupin family protein